MVVTFLIDMIIERKKYIHTIVRIIPKSKFHIIEKIMTTILINRLTD